MVPNNTKVQEQLCYLFRFESSCVGPHCLCLSVEDNGDLGVVVCPGGRTRGPAGEITKASTHYCFSKQELFDENIGECSQENIRQ